MIVETRLVHGDYMLRERILISEVELLLMPKNLRAEAIRTAKRLGFARVMNQWRKVQTTKDK